ncbi:MAG: LCP family protein [Cellulomonadaceae bacterium]|jgi:LCP family protein required for cell wall assembly|nr:LCP family protein [Cellulomonadaceae bacterium]
MSVTTTASARHRRGLHARHARRLPRAVARTIGIVTTAVIAFTGAGVAAAYADMSAAITVSDVDELLGDDRPEIPEPVDPTDPYAGRAVTMLVMGTDYRGGTNGDMFGGGEEFHADTTMVVYIAADRSWVEVVSIPRDSLVNIPACPRTDGSVAPAVRNAMFNDAFQRGGGPGRDKTSAAACTIRTVESLTGLRITDHAIIQMNGIIDVVDALGGVNVDLPEAVRGNRHVILDLPAGEQTLDGWQSINFLRARGGRGMGLEMGSDLARIERQQFFVDAAMREVLDQNLVTNVPSLYRVVQRSLAALSVNPDLSSPAALAGLAFSLRDINPENLIFTQLPIATAPRDPNRVVWTSAAAPIWARIAAGDPPPELFVSPVEEGADTGDGNSEEVDAE